MSGSFFSRARRQDFFVAFVLAAIRALPAPECDNHKAPLCHCTLALSLGTDNAWEDHHASWCQGFLSPFGLLSIGQQRGTGHGWGPQPRASETQWIILFFFFPSLLDYTSAWRTESSPLVGLPQAVSWVLGGRLTQLSCLLVVSL